MRFRMLCLLLLVTGALLAGCSSTPTALPEIITPQAPLQTEAPAITATPHPAGTSTALPSPTLTLRATPDAAWCLETSRIENRPLHTLRVGLVKDNDIWIWESGGNSRQLTEHGDVGQVFLSDDGLVVAYTRPSENGLVELWKVDIPDGNPEILFTADKFGRLRKERGKLGVIPYNIDWIPGTHKLAFNTYPVVRGEDIWIYIPDDLQIFDMDTRELTTLFPVGSGGHFSFSPDGEHLGLFSTDWFKVYSSEGIELPSGRLEEYRAIAYGEYYGYAWPQWSPDSEKLLLAIPAETDPLVTDAKVDLWEVSLNGRQPDLVKSFHSYMSESVISPDLQKVAYWKQAEPPSSGLELSIMGAYGKEDHLYATANVMERFQWSPDSWHYFFWYTESWDPWLGHLCEEPVQLTGLAVRSEIQWVDEKSYLYLSGTEGNWSLYLGELGGEQTKLEELGESYSFAFTVLP